MHLSTIQNLKLWGTWLVLGSRPSSPAWVTFVFGIRFTALTAQLDQHFRVLFWAHSRILWADQMQALSLVSRPQKSPHLWCPSTSNINDHFPVWPFGEFLNRNGATCEMQTFGTQWNFCSFVDLVLLFCRQNSHTPFILSSWDPTKVHLRSS